MEQKLLKDIVLRQIRATLRFEVPEPINAVLEEWMGQEIINLIGATGSIKNEDIRVKSITVMFGKHFAKAQKLYAILQSRGLEEDAELFRSLLSLM